jgi:uncharacterized membrane protein YeaQ/YmgE (transglycosylase-associated protein family)
MDTREAVLAWACFGLVAGIAAMTMPFRRGMAGLLLNVLVGVGGALLFGASGVALHLYPRASDPLSFAWATVGALGALGIVHGTWMKFSHRRA